MTIGNEPPASTRKITPEMAVEAINEVLANKRKRIQEVTTETTLEELELDSLEAAELFAALEDRSGLELDPDSARSLVTVGDLMRLQEA